MFKFVLVAGLCVRAAFHEFQDRRAGDEPPSPKRRKASRAAARTMRC